MMGLVSIHRCAVVGFWFAAMMLVCVPLADAAPPDQVKTYQALMPRVSDYTQMWWAEGFPAHTPLAPWWRCIQTGSYAMVLDTRSLCIPHLGAVAVQRDYLDCARTDNADWQQLPPAELVLTITVDETVYRATAGGAWSDFRGPRLIESGRFVQRADVTDLVFTADDGRRLNIEARLETVAWPDRLAIILAARPSQEPALSGDARPGRSGDACGPHGTHAGPARPCAFGGDGEPTAAQPITPSRTASMAIRLTTAEDRYEATSALQLDAVPPEQQPPESSVYVVLYPGTRQTAASSSSVVVEAREYDQGPTLSVGYDAARGWHRVDLNGIAPRAPAGEPARQNDAVERVTLVLTNPADDEQVVRLLFEKEGNGFRHRFGVPITGMSAVLRDADGYPVGIPVQLSKNWHARREGGTYAGTWFHGFSQVRLPPQTRVELELLVAYGHWGGVAAASHAQLCLIGWGSNQLWDQSALGAWGESICYEPDQAQAQAGVLDVRPLMVRSMDRGAPWSWTHNVGGADFFRAFDTMGHRVFPARMRTAYLRQGPCLTEVTYAGHTGRSLEHSATVSLYRSDDLVRGVYRLRLDVHEPFAFSRLVVFQMGADTYGYTAERKMAVGDETGVLREWTPQWGGNTYRTEPLECAGRLPWISLHEAVSRAPPEQDGAWANRGIVIRSWQARLGGNPARPWVAERGVHASGADTSTIDVLPPPGVTRLEPGDYVEAVMEHIVMPQFAADYYGPNEQLRAALGQWQDTWRMIHREALGNDLQVHARVGEVTALRPAVRVHAHHDRAELTLTGGVGYVPVTFTHLTAPRIYELQVNGQVVDQSTHGRDFWQTDYDPATGTWELTFTIPTGDAAAKHIVFSRVGGWGRTQ